MKVFFLSFPLQGDNSFLLRNTPQRQAFGRAIPARCLKGCPSSTNSQKTSRGRFLAHRTGAIEISFAPIHAVAHVQIYTQVCAPYLGIGTMEIG